MWKYIHICKCITIRPFSRKQIEYIEMNQTSLLLGGEEKGDFPASAAAIVKAGSRQSNKEAVISIFPIRTSTGIFAFIYIHIIHKYIHIYL
jgi:hypothetical protein